MHWLVERINYDNDNNVAQRLYYLLQELGIPVTTFQYIPFGGTDYSFIPQEPLIFFGSHNVVKDIRTRGIQVPEPFVWCDWELLSCKTYFQKLAPFILQKNPVFCTLQQLDESVFTDREMFIRPDDNEKSFVGSIVKIDLFNSWKRDMIEYRQCPQDLLVLVSPLQDIEAEWRAIVVDGKVVAGSQYKKYGQLEISDDFPKEVTNFAEQVAQHWSPHPVWVVDVGFVDNEYKVVEIGPFNYAGLYRCNLREIVAAIENYHERLPGNTRPI